jgi:hypothetical protein
MGNVEMTNNAIRKLSLVVAYIVVTIALAYALQGVGGAVIMMVLTITSWITCLFNPVGCTHWHLTPDSYPGIVICLLLFLPLLWLWRKLWRVIVEVFS